MVGGEGVLATSGFEPAALVVSVALLGVAALPFHCSRRPNIVACAAPGHFDTEVATGVLHEDVPCFHGVS